MTNSRAGCTTCLHTRNHLIKEIERVRHRRINIEEPTGTYLHLPNLDSYSMMERRRGIEIKPIK